MISPLQFSGKSVKELRDLFAWGRANTVGYLQPKAFQISGGLSFQKFSVWKHK